MNNSLPQAQPTKLAFYPYRVLNVFKAASGFFGIVGMRFGRQHSPDVYRPSSRGEESRQVRSQLLVCGDDSGRHSGAFSGGGGTQPPCPQ